MTRDNPGKCFVCGRADYRPVLKIEGITLWESAGCGQYTLYPRQKVHKDDDYSSVLDLAVYVSYMRPFRTAQYREELELIGRLNPGRKLLDIGCATGWFLAEAQKHGYEVTGLEPQKVLADIAGKEIRSASIIHGDIDNLKKNGEKFDVVTLWSVLEHPDNLVKDFRTISAVMPRGGILAIRTPNSRGLLQQFSILLYRVTGGTVNFPLRLILQMEFESKHWFLFNRYSLTHFLENFGFEVRTVRYSTSIDWRDLDDWFRARKRKPAGIIYWGMKIAFAVNELVATVFRLQDDLVLIAVKV